MFAAVEAQIRQFPVAGGKGLLAALPGDEYRRLAADLEPVRLKFNEVIYECGEPVRHVYFLKGAVVSMLSILEDGTTVEVGMVGDGGVVGIGVILGAEESSHWTVVDVAGEALRMRAGALGEWFGRSPALRRLLTRYYRALITQFCQRSVCNCRHMILQRLSTWLLMIRDHVGSDDLPLTQDLISRRLGSRRASVTGAYNHLQQAGIIDHGRGHITIQDRRRLEVSACECYRIITGEFDGLLRP